MYRFASFAVLPLIALTACAEDSTEIANPAAVFCVDKGGTYEIRNTDDGQVGICTLPDGTQVDAWDYFRTENPD